MNITECEEVERAEPNFGIGSMTCFCEQCHESFEFHKDMELPKQLFPTLVKGHVQNVRPSARPPAAFINLLKPSANFPYHKV